MIRSKERTQVNHPFRMRSDKSAISAVRVGIFHLTRADVSRMVCRYDMMYRTGVRTRRLRVHDIFGNPRESAMKIA